MPKCPPPYLKKTVFNISQSFTVNIIVFAAEIDISVSKLLGFETFANFLKVSVSVSENLVSEKNLGFGFGKFGFQKSPGFGLRKFGLGKKSWLRF